MSTSGAGVSSGAWASPRFIPGPAGSDATTLGQLNAVGRFGGVWLDPRLRRVGYGAAGTLMPTSAAEAKAARSTPQHRFRMRYAVMTEDLSGNLLMFPEAEPAQTAGQSPDYRAVWRPGVNNNRLKDQSTGSAIANSADLAEPLPGTPATFLAAQKSPTATNNVALDWARWAADAPRGERLMRWSPAFFDVLHVAGMDPTRLAMSLRHEHVYQLRGAVINQARINDDLVINNNDPVTFPWMFRCTPDPDNTTWSNTPASISSFGSPSSGYGRSTLAATSGSSGVTSWQTILPQGGRVIDSSVSRGFGLIVQSYAINNHSGYGNTRLAAMEHNLVGILPSWSAIMAAAMGGGPDNSYYGHVSTAREAEFTTNSNHLTLNMVTPFGRGLDNKAAGTASSKTYRWHDAGTGGSDAAIAVNAITALPAVIGGLIYSTLPPPVIAQQATIEQFLPCTGLDASWGTPAYGSPVTARQFFLDNQPALSQAKPYDTYTYTKAEYNGATLPSSDPVSDFAYGAITNLPHFLFSAGGGISGTDNFFATPNKKWPTDSRYQPQYWLVQKGNLLYQSGEPLVDSSSSWSLRDLWTSETQPGNLSEFLPPIGRGFIESRSPPRTGATTVMLFSGASLRPNYYIGDMLIRDDTFMVRRPGTNYPGMGCVTLDPYVFDSLASTTTSAAIADDLGQFMRTDQFCRSFPGNQIPQIANPTILTTTIGSANRLVSTDPTALDGRALTCMPRDPYQFAPLWADDGNTTTRVVKKLTLGQFLNATNPAVLNMSGRFTRKKASSYSFTRDDNTSATGIGGGAAVTISCTAAAFEPPRAGIWTAEIKPWGRNRLNAAGAVPMSVAYSRLNDNKPIYPPEELYPYDQILYKFAANNMNYVEPKSGPLQCGFAMTQAIAIFRTWFMLESSQFFNPLVCNASNPPSKRDRNWLTSCGFRGNTPTADGSAAKLAPRNGGNNYTLEDLDAIFLRQFGIKMDDLSVSATSVEPFGIGIDVARGYMCIFSPLPPAFKIPENGVVNSVTAHQNLADLSYKAVGMTPPSSATPTRIEDPTKYPWAYSTSATEPRRLPVAYLSLGQVKIAILERFINDFRMSLLGASPDYDGSTNKLDGVTRPKFYPLDLDQDGRVLCSAYSKKASWYLGTGSGPLLFDSTLDPSATKGYIDSRMTFYSLDRWEPVDASSTAKQGRGPTRAPGSTYPNFFSVAGVMLLRKSHFFRVWTRGELWDDLVQKPVAQVDMDSAVCVDPNGNGTQADDLTVLYQKQWVSRYNAQLSAPNN